MKTEQRNLSYKPMEEFKWNRKKLALKKAREEQRVQLFANNYQGGTHYYN